MENPEYKSIFFITDNARRETPIARGMTFRIRDIMPLIFSFLSSEEFFGFVCINSSIDTSRISASLGNELTSGQDKSRSHLDTALSVTPIFSARLSCVIACSFLSSAILVPSVCFFNLKYSLPVDISIIFYFIAFFYSTDFSFTFFDLWFSYNLLIVKNPFSFQKTAS